MLYTVNCCRQLIIPCNRHACLTVSVLLLQNSCGLFVQSTMQPRLFPALLHFLPLLNCSGTFRCYVSTVGTSEELQRKGKRNGTDGLNLVVAAMQVELVAAQYEQLSFGKAIDAIQKVSARGNLFLQEREPWAAFKKVHTHSHCRDMTFRLPSCRAWHWTCHGWALACLSSQTAL